MYENDLNDRCPACGGTIGYHINSYGQVVKQCNWCNHVIADDVVVTDKTTITDNNYVTYTNNIISKKALDKLAINHDINPAYSITTPSQTLEIKCDSITLKQNDISICFCSEKDIKQFDSITINGIKFKRVEENNE